MDDWAGRYSAELKPTVVSPRVLDSSLGVESLSAFDYC